MLFFIELKILVFKRSQARKIFFMKKLNINMLANSFFRLLINKYNKIISNEYYNYLFIYLLKILQ